MDESKLFNENKPLSDESENESLFPRGTTSAEAEEPPPNDPKTSEEEPIPSPTQDEDRDSAANEMPPPQCPNNPLREVAVQIEKICLSINETAEASKKTSSEIREIHKLYHNEFAHRLKSMQDELDEYHKADRGRMFDDILSAIARIYGNNESLVDEIEDAKVKKSVKYMLLDLLDLLEEYGVQRLKSSPGDKRNTRHCQVLERIPTDDSSKHDTVASSHNSGFFIGNRTIIKEMVDIYLFSGNIPSPAPTSPVSSETPGGSTEAEPHIEN